jgi:hypothetical protein
MSPLSSRSQSVAIGDELTDALHDERFGGVGIKEPGTRVGVALVRPRLDRLVFAPDARRENIA